MDFAQLRGLFPSIRASTPYSKIDQLLSLSGFFRKMYICTYIYVYYKSLPYIIAFVTNIIRF